MAERVYLLQPGSDVAVGRKPETAASPCEPFLAVDRSAEGGLGTEMNAKVPHQKSGLDGNCLRVGDPQSSIEDGASGGDTGQPGTFQLSPGSADPLRGGGSVGSAVFRRVVKGRGIERILNAVGAG